MSNEIIVLTLDQYRDEVRTMAVSIASEIIRTHLAKHEPQAVTRSETARLLGKAKSTVTNMINEGRIRTTADGKLIPRSEIERYLNNKQ